MAFQAHRKRPQTARLLRISAKPDSNSGLSRTVRIPSSERSDERFHLVDLLSAVNADLSLRIEGPLISIL